MRGSGFAPDGPIAHYAWDFDGDGAADVQSAQTGHAAFRYPLAGIYQATLTVTDIHGQTAADTMRVVVRPGSGTQTAVGAGSAAAPPGPSSIPGDGVTRRYAVMFNGGAEARYWNDVTFMYATLRNDYQFTPEQIYLLNYQGSDPNGLNPDSMIDYPATLVDLDAVFTHLATVIDRDDELLVWFTDHGRGYLGPDNQAYGYLDGFASVDPGDEQDMLERDFKVSIDEKLVAPNADIRDDELAVLLDRIDAELITIFMEQCFGGGFIDDLSAPNRVIATATEEDHLSYGNLFVGLFTEALHNRPSAADSDGNGYISMREAFTYAAQRDSYNEIPQYDDNGDGVGHPQPIPQGGDGDTGARAYLAAFYRFSLTAAAEPRAGDPGSTVTHTLQIQNLGSQSDQLILTLDGGTWPMTVPVSLGPLGASRTTDLSIPVSIPVAAAGEATDRATLTIRSQGDPAQSATVALTTRANPIYGFTLTPESQARTGVRGGSITYTILVTNTGNYRDTMLIAVGDAAWPTTVPTSIRLEAGQRISLTVQVAIPAGAASGAADHATLTIRSQGNGARVATVRLSTSTPYTVFLPAAGAR